MTTWLEKPDSPTIYEPGTPDVRPCTCRWCDPDTTEPIMTCRITGGPAPMLPDPFRQPESPARIKPHRMVEIRDARSWCRPPDVIETEELGTSRLTRDPRLPNPFRQPVVVRYDLRGPSRLATKIRNLPRGLLIAVTLSALAIAVWALITIGGSL